LCAGRIKSPKLRLDSMRYALLAALHRIGRIDVGTLKLSSALKAHPVASLLDGKHTAHLTMTTAKHEPEHPKQGFHTSCDRLRSQLPLASSHLSRVRTLLRAKAIAQSAAP
jgi:hypothetical protein